jgi:hypothetical protein
VFAVIHAADASWTSPVTAAALAAGLALLAVLVFAERRAAQPIMPLRLFASRAHVGAYLARLLYLGAIIGFFYFGTQYLQDALGFTAFEAGVAFFPMTVVNFAVAMAFGRRGFCQYPERQALPARGGSGLPGEWAAMSRGFAETREEINASSIPIRRGRRPGGGGRRPEA